MKDSFDNLDELMRQYELLKLEVRSCSTLLPQKDKDFKNQGNLSSKLNKEEKFALIVDVESFIKYYHDKQICYSPIPYPCIVSIFYLAFNCRSLTRLNSYGKLAQKFKILIDKKERIPRRLQNKSNIYTIGSNMRKVAEEYYIGKGLIRNIDKKSL